MCTRKRLGRASIVFAGLLALASGAHAQSSVTLYGLVDGGLLFLSKTQNASGGNGGRFIGFTDSGQVPSQFGLTGTEELGGGLAAEFRLESGIDIGNGGYNDSNGNFFGREAYLGLKGAFGEVKAGLQFSPFFNTLFALDPRGLSQFGSSLGIYVNNVAATGIFNANALSYESPLIEGFQGSVMFAPGGVAGNFPSGRQYSASLSWQWNGFTVSGALYDGNPGGSVVTTTPTNLGFDGRMIGVSWKYDKLTAKASFTNYKIAGSGMNNNVYGGGLDYFVMPDVDLNGGVWYVNNRNDSTDHSVLGALGASYFLSHRTTLYAQVGVVDNHGAENLGLSVGDVPTSLLAPPGKTVGAEIGMRHAF
ncbi:porin [Paraburkholderia ferrariae]|uniref:porin n=1 Tax=Paraburkholderia ferrariae TaxID=386056 RepID=UPI0005A6670A|nr:porin [Paraburkholderia ferrariae]